MKLFQIRKQEKLQGHIAGANPHLPHIHAQDPFHHLLTFQKALHPYFNIAVQKFTLLSKLDTFGRPQEQLNPRFLFQLAHGLADCRLGDAQLPGSRSQAPMNAHIVKHPVIFQIYIHP